MLIMLTCTELKERLTPEQKHEMWCRMQVCLFGSAVNITLSVTQQVNVSSASLRQNISQVQNCYYMKVTKTVYLTIFWVGLMRQLQWWWNQGGWHGRDMWPIWDRVKHKRFRGKPLKDKGHLEGLEIGGGIIWKLILKKLNGNVCTECTRLRIETSLVSMTIHLLGL